MEKPPRQCSKPSCKNTLPPEEPGQQLYKKCANCHAKNTLATAKAHEKKWKCPIHEDEKPAEHFANAEANAFDYFETLQMVSSTSSNSQITGCWRPLNEMVLGFSASRKIVSAVNAALIHLDLSSGKRGDGGISSRRSVNRQAPRNLITRIEKIYLGLQFM